MMNKLAIVEKKVEDLESKLNPILSIPPDPLSDHQPITDGINTQLVFIENLISAEISLSPTTPNDDSHQFHLGQIARKVRTLQSGIRKWAEARPTYSSSVEPESCIVDDDPAHEVEEEEEEKSTAVGFTVYDNPEYRHSNVEMIEDYDDGEEEEDENAIIEFGNQRINEAEDEEEEEVMRIYDEKEKTEYDYERGDKNWCLKIIFWIIMIFMGFTFVMVGFPESSDNQMFLTPT